MPEQPIFNNASEGETSLYVYEAQMYEDLHEAVDEYMGESEHNGFDGFQVKLSDVKSFDHKKKLAKVALWRDFGEYIKQMADNLEEEMNKEWPKDKSSSS